MLKQQRQDWICSLVGDGPLKSELMQQCRYLGLEEQVVFFGDCSDVPGLLKQADIFVLPSLQDNLPFSVMEAQTAGKPIVCSDADGIPEMVLHGTTGMMSRAGNSEAMYSNLLHILQDDALRSRIGETARQWAILRWSLRTIIDKTMDAYSLQ